MHASGEIAPPLLPLPATPGRGRTHLYRVSLHGYLCVSLRIDTWHPTRRPLGLCPHLHQGGGRARHVEGKATHPSSGHPLCPRDIADAFGVKRAHLEAHRQTMVRWALHTQGRALSQTEPLSRLGR